MKHLTACIVAGLLLGAAAVQAHLCNDIFAQARDNLAVKVDIRDGQLRIGKDASFKVYLLNTMDRDIVSINLEVQSQQFTAEVKPSSDWQSYPALKTSKKGGKKEYFTVTLARKPGVPDGKYKINLRLTDGKGKGRELKTVDLDAAAAVHALARTPAIKIDGAVGQAEWDKAVLCSDFTEYKQPGGGFFESLRAQNQPRIRVAADAQNLYCLLNVPAAAGAAPVATLYASSSPDGSAQSLAIDCAKAAPVDAAVAGVEIRKSADGSSLECKIPRKLLGIDAGTDFYLNFTCKTQGGDKETVAYWRGNKFSFDNPVVYDRFILAN